MGQRHAMVRPCCPAGQKEELSFSFNLVSSRNKVLFKSDLCESQSRRNIMEG